MEHCQEWNSPILRFNKLVPRMDGNDYNEYGYDELYYNMYDQQPAVNYNYGQIGNKHKMEFVYDGNFVGFDELILVVWPVMIAMVFITCCCGFIASYLSKCYSELEDSIIMQCLESRGTIRGRQAKTSCVLLSSNNQIKTNQMNKRKVRIHNLFIRGMSYSLMVMKYGWNLCFCFPFAMIHWKSIYRQNHLLILHSQLRSFALFGLC